MTERSRTLRDSSASVAPFNSSTDSTTMRSSNIHNRLLSGSIRRPQLRGPSAKPVGVQMYRQRAKVATVAEGDQETRAAHRSHSIFSTRSSVKDRGSVRYRRIQNKIYNILERPKDCRAVTYHVLSFAVVFACLVLSIVQSADDSINLLNEISMSVELLMLLWFTSEYVLRIWSAGCRSKYQSFTGRLRFARRPLCIIDAVVIIASVVVVVMNANARISEAAEQFLNVTEDQATSGGNMVPALRGLRFFQIMRMMRLDRRGSSWRLLSSVVWAHRQELFTAVYTGFLVLIFASFAMYLAEREENDVEFKSYADALWWGVITLCTVGYGDKVPKTAMGRVIGSACAMIGISFFALPPGILGSGLALKVQQQQRQKHQIRRRVPAAMLIQAMWRMVATEEDTVLTSTWRYYINHQRRTKQLLCTGGVPPSMQIPHMAGSSVADRLQMVAGRLVSVSRKSFRDRRESAGIEGNMPPGIVLRQYNRGRRGQGTSDGDSSPPEIRNRAPSMENPTGPLTDSQCHVIRAVRKLKFMVCRRKFRESMRPYDVKDVIEQYSTGHAEILSRLRQLQYRVDDLAFAVASYAPPSKRPSASEPILEGAVSGTGDSIINTMNSHVPDSDLHTKMAMLDRKLSMLLEMTTPNVSSTGASYVRIAAQSENETSRSESAPPTRSGSTRKRPKQEIVDDDDEDEDDAILPLANIVVDDESCV